MPVGLAAAVVGLVVTGRVRQRSARTRARELNERLAGIDWTPPAKAGAQPVASELDEDDLGTQRWLVDLGLQPMDEFKGFDWIDQFQTSSVRYQLTYAQMALAMAQYTHTPAFTGYQAEAQRGLIEKMQDKRVWRFWFLENLWGYLKIQRNPIPPRDNIMFTGYLGTMLGAYEQVTGDDRYTRDGALTFRWNDKHEYEQNFNSIAENVHSNMSISPFCFYPCEPNWIYSICNAIGINTLIAHDELHGTSYYEDIADSYQTGLEQEFLTADGRLVGIRSARMGFGLPAITSTMADALAAYWLSPSLPEVSRRSWEVVRHRFVHLDEDGLRVDRSGWDNIDTGNYKAGTDIVVCWGIMIAAREHGDEEVAQAVQRYVDEKFEPTVNEGARRYAKASTQSNGTLAMARFGRQNGLHDMISHGVSRETLEGPVLSEAAYPEVLVARADHRRLGPGPGAALGQRRRSDDPRDRAPGPGPRVLRGRRRGRSDRRRRRRPRPARRGPRRAARGPTPTRGLRPAGRLDGLLPGDRFPDRDHADRVAMDAAQAGARARVPAPGA